MSTLYRPTHSKSRNGCTRCKAKRLRCDQRKPGCKRCEESGTQCPGYVLNLRWSAKNQLQQKSVSSIPSQKPSTGRTAETTSATVGDTAAISESSDLSSLLLFPGVHDYDPLPFSTLLDPSYYPVFSGDIALPQWPFPGLGSSVDSAGLEKTNAWGGTFSEMPMSSQTSENPSIGEDWLYMETHHACNDLDMADSNGVLRQDTSQAIDTPLALPQELNNLPTALSDFFIKEVIPLYCAWDSQVNPMRVVAEKAWQSSKILFHTMQSMAAACLTSVLPELSATAIQERLLALRCLDETSSSSVDYPEARMLATVLLCHTASWHDPGNLAKDRFQMTRKLVLDWASTATETDSKSMSKFFQTAVDYWGMLLSFFTDISTITDPTLESPIIGPREPADQLTLHPFVGISGQTVKTLTDVGNLVSQYRSRVSTVRFITEEDMDFFKDKIREARCLEKRLLAYKPVDTSKMQDTDDPRTPLTHLANIDDAYRCVGLLQIYRVFSDLLAERYNPWGTEEIFSARPPSKKPTKAEKDYWLTSLALYTLGLLRDIPFESRSRSIQPLILVAISNELRRVPQDVASLSVVDQQARELGQTAIELAQARNFIKSRLSAYADVLPLRKVGNILELVTSIWNSLDEGEADVYWLDICTRKQLHTLIG
ncbi:hypothetical protein NW762_014051 [Fusarium torreyae]|uniref:Zn(2)-C6 fungal-type domain-containing protein n=1 Tax=Fusarium torreyae TaxID=1237075 RepID=A0A9W8RJN0_9HYPO|nr:hypothetical protein NW762_014051 [Fusarium torreyae]